MRKHCSEGVCGRWGKRRRAQKKGLVPEVMQDTKGVQHGRDAWPELFKNYWGHHWGAQRRATAAADTTGGPTTSAHHGQPPHGAQQDQRQDQRTGARWDRICHARADAGVHSTSYACDDATSGMAQVTLVAKKARPSTAAHWRTLQARGSPMHSCKNIVKEGLRFRFQEPDRR